MPQRSSVAPRVKRFVGVGVMLAFVGGGCGGGGGQLGAQELSQQSKALQSEAAEGSLLAQDAASGRTTRIYTREHASDLHGVASRAERALKVATTEPALEPQVRRLAVVAGRVSTDLERLASASRDEARALARDLQAAARASRKIGDGLE